MHEIAGVCLLCLANNQIISTYNEGRTGLNWFTSLSRVYHANMDAQKNQSPTVWWGNLEVFY